ncbi:MAG TPA: phage major capsid protein, partial [Glycomyces sp.]|nr:phage major capsid protein [Glycomyces sp.]
MSAQNFADWVPEEWGGPVINKIAETSAVEALARTEAMGTDTKHVLRSAGMGFQGAIAKSEAYPEATGVNDEVLLTARKFGAVVRIADEDMKDTAGLVNLIQQKQLEWARGHAIGFDNACLGVTNETPNGSTVPFLSLYAALHSTNNDTGYTAEANIVETDGALTYATLSAAFELVETSDYYNEGSMVVIAHPSFKARLREITGVVSDGDGGVVSDHRPVFEEHSRLGTGAPDRIFGVPVRWTLGAKTNATAGSAPTGNPLLFVGNRELLIKGARSGPEYMVAGADTGAAFLTDEALLKMRI